MGVVKGLGQVAAHGQQTAGVNARNRQRLRQHYYDQQNYINEAKLDNAEYSNEVIANEVEQEGVFQAMVDQWTQLDQQLDQMFAKSSFKMQDSIIKMYENEYAGSQTGATAGRLAASSAKKKGFEIAKEVNGLLLAKEEVSMKKGMARTSAISKVDKLYEKIRFPPVHGHAPVPPQLEAKPSSASLMLGLAGAGLQSYGMSKMSAPKDTGMSELGDGGIDLDAIEAYSSSGDGGYNLR